MGLWHDLAGERMAHSAVDISIYERVGGTHAGAYHLAEPGILLAVPRPGYRQTVTGARASLAEQVRISTQLGEPLVVLILVEPVADQDRGSRQVWTDEADPRYMLGLGLVGATPLARAIGSFFMGLTRPRVPTSMLVDLDDGLRWAHALRAREGHAGAI